ncbi:MAG: putative glycolipid-binding domain-containing protein [Gaiellaceae bacterium]
MEIAHVRGERAQGTQIGLAYELRYALSPGRLTLEVVDGAAAELELDGADFFDLAYSPLFNSLPVWAGLDEPREYTMRFVDVPSLEVSESTQTYEPAGPGRVRFRSGSFEALIEFDGDGLVTRYEGLAERVG